MGMPAFGGAYPYAPEITPEEEVNILKSEAEILKRELKDIQGRIESLEKAQVNKAK